MIMKTFITLVLSLLTIGQAVARLEASNSFHRILGRPVCGDGTCRSDCAECPNGADAAGVPCCTVVSQCNNDGTCDADETFTNCAQDCFCGNDTCDADETCASCPQDCCTSPNCPDEATSCLCTDGATSCSNDQDCPGTTINVSGTCSSGSRKDLTCTTKENCPKGQSYADCLGGQTVVSPPEEGSCRSCSGVQESSGLITGNINQCDNGHLCGDFSNNAIPVTCVSCLEPMTCNAWCNIEDHLGWYNGKTLDSYTASTSCPGGGYDSCACTLSSFWANSWTISTNTHAGAICDAHNFGACGNGDDWCAVDFPSVNYCESLGPVSISGTLDADGVCTCHATIWGSATLGIPAAKKDVWSSECIENLYVYNHGPNGAGELPYLGLPCSFTG